MKLAKLALVAILAIPLSGCVFSLGGGCSKSVHDRRLERIERRLDRIEGNGRNPIKCPDHRCSYYDGRMCLRSDECMKKELEAPKRPASRELYDAWCDEDNKSATESMGAPMVHYIQSVRKWMKAIIRDTPYGDRYEDLKGILDGDEKYYKGESDGE